ncbi:hypothetical protein B0H16DRAFT_1703325 [Mycena metata]|uniref:Uncharacterized protein n=1 Tax=Mycena metata TaxID=1033252 RepID=A0AAD7MDB1_9AGAR|nr:hypothetical protein B0H16DRAFT_1703325 [Mycena metata]
MPERPEASRFFQRYVQWFLDSPWVRDNPHSTCVKVFYADVIQDETNNMIARENTLREFYTTGSPPSLWSNTQGSWAGSLCDLALAIPDTHGLMINKVQLQVGQCIIDPRVRVLCWSSGSLCEWTQSRFLFVRGLFGVREGLLRFRRPYGGFWYRSRLGLQTPFVSPRQSYSIYDLSASLDPEMCGYRPPDVGVCASLDPEMREESFTGCWGMRSYTPGYKKVALRNAGCG